MNSDQVHPHDPPPRIAHVFKHYGITPEDTPERVLMSDKQDQFLYFVKSQEFTKIGIATSMKNRLGGIQCGNPHKVSVVSEFHGIDAATTEQRLHDTLADFRYRGEWFSLPQELVDDIACSLSIQDVYRAIRTRLSIEIAPPVERV